MILVHMRMRFQRRASTSQRQLVLTGVVSSFFRSLCDQVLIAATGTFDFRLSVPLSLSLLSQQIA